MSLVLVKWLHSNLKLNENKCVLRCRDVCNLYCTKPYAHLHCLVARYYISHTCYCIFMNGKCQWRTWQFLTIIFRSFNNGSDLEKGTTWCSFCWNMMAGMAVGFLCDLFLESLIDIHRFIYLCGQNNSSWSHWSCQKKCIATVAITALVCH